MNSNRPILLRIADILLLNASFIDNLGLMHGKMGISIFFYHLARKLDNKVFESFAEELLDEIFDEININTPLDFENGLTGIGWGIEYLFQNGFVYGDTNESLYEIDNSVLKGLPAKPINVNDKLIWHIGLYLLARHREGKGNNSHCILQIKKQFNNLLYESDESQFSSKVIDNELTDLNYDELFSKYYFLTESYRRSVLNREKIIQILENILQSEGISTNQIVLYAIRYRCEKILMSSEMKYYGSLNDLNFKKIWSEGESSVVDFVRSVYYQLLYQIDFEKMPGINIMYENATKIINTNNNWDFRVKSIGKNNLGLVNGLAGLGLALVTLKHTS